MHNGKVVNIPVKTRYVAKGAGRALLTVVFLDVGKTCVILLDD